MKKSKRSVLSLFAAATLLLLGAATTSSAHPADPTGDIIRYLLYGQEGIDFASEVDIATTEGWLGAGTGGLGFNNGGAYWHIGSPIRTRGGLRLQHVDNTVAPHDWYVVGDIANSSAWGNLTVQGDVRATGSIAPRVAASGSRVENDPTVASLVPNIDISSYNYDVPVGTGSRSISSGTLPAGTYGTVNVNGIVTFGEGDYYFDNLIIGSGAGITVSKPVGATTRILVKNNFSFNGWSNHGIQLDGTDYGRMMLYAQNAT
ncbi:MAG: hypothetical protein J6V65_03400, partial [Fibrobacterales bacterium]|nr:hypothetical protein [Fibrobacterales bacterium]